ncbi:GH92 family glycosyl hydrolase [Litorihabitans aurantiacus]|uniref:SLH domain-containing protein n=1 Tax=Litorihabitans aurantiacus TaxID=1930061 RepID=A0AA38CTE7_9MICO|nr:GH92 family glycosyl hydrolase [Litorihabitans aurantiacus]GMA31812.1 hypothetical protein GCM10025875_18040 [Litorihabitans aurantiacus]
MGADGTLSGWVEGGSGWPGRTRMFVAGQFDATPTDARATTTGNRNGSARFAAFDTSDDDTVELRIATSFISQDQARKNLDLEVTGRSFEDVQAAATAAWNERLEVLEIEGATQDQRVTTYSNLYRLNLYPNSQFENTGTAEAPVYRYASPVSPTVGSATATQTNAQIKDGKVYVNNGFWDTYRTVWPLYSTLYPELAEELVDGFTQQYRDGGWVARWSSPGYADLMTGTSSDVAFADAYLAGALGSGESIEQVLETYDAALKNATVLPPSNNVGRKGLETSIFQGWTQQGTHESASWGLEGYINDFGIAEMAAALAQDERVPAERRATLAEEAAYFEARSKNYVTMFNPEANTFTARYRNGDFAAGADFDKLAWGGDFTEASAWTFGFHVPFDVDGLAALYGGRQGLVDVLDEFMTTPEIARSGIHEAFEARDVRLGLLGMSNQVAHHIPYIYAAAGKPSATQELVRDINKRLFVGADIGQGYLGDEDNGEMSSWQLFSALGFYPLQVGSGDFTIGSPMFDRATLKLPGGDLVVSAPGASQGQVYVDGVTFDGEPIEDVVLDGDLVRGGGELTFTMSETPSDWGGKDMTEELEVPAIPVDATKPGNGTLTAADGTDVSALVDDDARTAVTFPGDEAVLTWSGGVPVAVDRYTLTDGEGGHPADWVLEGSDDGETWIVLDERAGQEFPWDTQTRPFAVAEPAVHVSYRLTISAATGPLVLSELELFASPGQAESLVLTPLPGVVSTPGAEVVAPLASVAGPSSEAADYAVEVDYRDGTGPHAATLTPGSLGGFVVTAPHALERAGVYDAVVTATLGEENATATVRVRVERDETLVGSFTTVCIGDLGRTAGSCDGQGYTYDRAKLASTGFVQGETIEVGEAGLSFDLPLVEPGRPDAVSNAGQTVALQLGDGATRISFVGTANEGDKDLRGTLTFTDGSTQEVPLQFGDWVGASGAPVFGNVVVGTSNGRLSGVSAESTVKRTSVYATAPVELDTDDAGEPKEVASLTLPTSTGEVRSGRIHLMAVADDGDRSAIAPLTVTAREVGPATTGVELSAALADVTGGAAGASASVSWGDESELADAEVVDGVVSAAHTYAEAGTYTATVTVDDGALSRSVDVEVVVEDEVPVDLPSLAVAPGAVVVGAQVTLTGADFAPDETVTVTLPGGETRSVTADAEGAFTHVFTLPAGTQPGAVEVTARGALSDVEATATLTVLPPAFTFVDVPPGLLFHDEITWLAGRGVTTGWELGDGTREYRPLAPINRDAMAAFLYRLAGSPDFTAPTVSPFVDVATDNQFYREIAWLHAQKISTGWAEADGSVTFRPLQPIARDAMAAFLFRYAQVGDYQAPATSAFTDVDPGNQFYREISWLAESGVSTGWKGNDGTAIYRPLTPINRDAMAAFMYRLDRLG